MWTKTYSVMLNRLLPGYIYQCMGKGIGANKRYKIHHLFKTTPSDQKGHRKLGFGTRENWLHQLLLLCKCVNCMV